MEAIGLQGPVAGQYIIVRLHVHMLLVPERVPDAMGAGIKPMTHTLWGAG